jgi:ribonuclease HI
LEPSPRKLLLTPQTENPDWRIRESVDSFTNWWRTKNLTTIFFDGASKGNPGNAGAGGVIYSPDGTLRDCFCWGLGQKTNNQAEILGLLRACLIVREKGDKDLQVFGDSELLIKKLNSKDLFNNASLNKMLGRLKRILHEFSSFKFYHILRNMNEEADQMANKGCTLAKGQILINDVNSYQIP